MWSFEVIINLQNVLAMRGLEVPQYLIAFIIANGVAVVLLLLAWKQPRIARILFSILFIWACYTNWHVALTKPNDYLFYANLTFSNVYKSFILGWFKTHIPQMIGFIATCQGLISISFLLKSWIYNIGSVGAIIFLLAIAPLGVGSAFPCTVVMAVALYILLREKKPGYLWHKPHHQEISVAY
jgi:hypothetical protein